MIAVLAPEPIRPRMAGMGIRALELARVLAREFETRLLVPNDPGEAREAAGDLEVAAAPPGRLARRRAGREGGARLGARGERLVSRGPGSPRRRRSLRSLPDREPPLRADARRGHGASRPGDARARARPRRFLPVRVLRAAAVLRRRALRARPDRRRRTFPTIPRSGAFSRRCPSEFPESPASGDRAAGRRAAGVPEAGPLVLFGGIYDWYDPGLLLDAWPDVRETRSRRAASLFREPQPGDDAPGRLRGRARAPRRRSIPPAGRSCSRPGCPTRRAPISTRLRISRSRSPPRAWRPSSPYRTRLLDAAWGGVPSVAVAGGALGARARRGRRGDRVRRATRALWPHRSRGCSSTPRGGKAWAAAARRSPRRATWGSVAAPLAARGRGTRAWIRAGCPAAAGAAGRGRRLPPRARSFQR